MAKVLITTVWHTGSNYLRQELKAQGHDVEFMHCEPRMFARKHLARFDEIHTTYRDAFAVGASWGNRYDLHQDVEIQAHWYSLWDCYRLLLSEIEPHVHDLSAFSGPKINQFLDERLLHKAIKDDNWGHYMKYVPPEMVGHAILCSKLHHNGEVPEYLP